MANASHSTISGAEDHSEVYSDAHFELDPGIGFRRTSNCTGLDPSGKAEAGRGTEASTTGKEACAEA